MENIKKYLEGVKGIIFDYGGTLDTGGLHWSHVLRRGWAEAGVAADDPTFREAYVETERELARTRHILPEHDFRDLLLVKARLEMQWLAMKGLLPPGDIEAKAEKIADWCDGFAGENVRGSVPVLEALSAKFPLVMVSNFYGNLKVVLSRYGVEKYFKKVIESAVVGVRKPDSRIFRLGVEALEMDAENVLAIGDSYTKDIVPAREAGCRAVWLEGKGWEADDSTHDYPYTITSLSELTKYLA